MFKLNFQESPVKISEHCIIDYCSIYLTKKTQISVFYNIILKEISCGDRATTQITTNYSGTEANLLRELEEITNPYIFGLHLGIDSKVVDRIDRDHRNDVERQRSEVIMYWYRNTKVLERTWGKVADAIKTLGGHRNLEMKLRQLHVAVATLTGT